VIDSVEIFLLISRNRGFGSDWKEREAGQELKARTVFRIGRDLLAVARPVRGFASLGGGVLDYRWWDDSDKHAGVGLPYLDTGIGTALPGTVINAQSGRIRWYRID
jgi:hypothetical protein